MPRISMRCERVAGSLIEAACAAHWLGLSNIDFDITPDLGLAREDVAIGSILVRQRMLRSHADVAR
jgi:hypothetical protein